MGEQERQEHADVMEFLHRLAGQHGELSRELSASKSHLEHEIEDLKDEVENFCKWMQAETKRSAWFYQAQPQIKQLVDSAIWVKTTRKFLAWIVGAILGTIMAISTVEIFVRDHLPK